ncbi:MAG: MCE family protein [Bdellovibrionales bacterium]|nr:MCE family protein [Bdellovibrionales bacterium]
METSKVYDIKVGLFVVIGVLLFLASILVVGGDKVFLSKYISFKGKSTSTQGLATGSIVSLSGIQIGNVRKLDFSENNAEITITMDIEEKYKHRITSTTTFSIKTQGALGDKYIFLDPGDLLGTPLEEGSYIQNNSNKDLLDILAEKGNDFGKAADIVVEVHKLLKTINGEDRSQKLMENLLQVSGNLNVLVKETHQTLKDFRKDLNPKEFGSSMSHLSNIMRKIDEGDGTLGALVNDSTLHHRLLRILGAPERNKYLKPIIRKSIKQGDHLQSNKTSMNSP